MALSQATWVNPGCGKLPRLTRLAYLLHKCELSVVGVFVSVYACMLCAAKEGTKKGRRCGILGVRLNGLYVWKSFQNDLREGGEVFSCLTHLAVPENDHLLLITRRRGKRAMFPKEKQLAMANRVASPKPSSINVSVLYRPRPSSPPISPPSNATIVFVSQTLSVFESPPLTLLNRCQLPVETIPPHS